MSKKTFAVLAVVTIVAYFVGYNVGRTAAPVEIVEIPKPVVVYETVVVERVIERVETRHVPAK